MQDLTGKVAGSQLTSAEWNQLPGEVQALITVMGITLSSGDLNQLGKALAGLIPAATYYRDIGAADAYDLDVTGTKQFPAALDSDHDGMMFRFRPANANTGASTVDINGLGPLDLVHEDGSPLNANDLLTSRDAIVRYDDTSGDFILMEFTNNNQANAVVPRGYIDGFEMRRDPVDTDHDIEIGLGIARDGANSMTLELTSVLTKQIDATHAAGDNAGGRAPGVTLDPDTWYHVFLIRRTSDGLIDAMFDTSPSAANIPAGFGEFRYIGSVQTDASSNLLEFTQHGDEFIWDDPVVEHSASINSDQTLNVAGTPPDFPVRGRYAIEANPNGFSAIRIGLFGEGTGSGNRVGRMQWGAVSIEGNGWGEVMPTVAATPQLELVIDTSGGATQVDVYCYSYNNPRGKE